VERAAALEGLPSSERRREEIRRINSRATTKYTKTEEPEIPCQVLRNIVLNNTSSSAKEDRNLFMMFCGVDCLENIQQNNKLKHISPEVQEH